MLAKPKFELRSQSLIRCQLVMQVLQSMVDGGTAFDVRERLIEVTGERHSIAPVKECLHHLANLDLVTCDVSANGHWWTARKFE